MLRGPEHDYAWCDDIAKWPQAREAWDNLQLGLRRGANPCAVVTTTPRAGSLVKALSEEADAVRTGGGSRQNICLPEHFFTAIERRYAGTWQGAEILEGRILADVAGSLWPSELIERCRVKASPSLPREGNDSREDASEGWVTHFKRIVIGVDPPASANGTCGIVACAMHADHTYTVLADESVEAASPEAWAGAVATAAERWNADRVIAEKNQGGDMVQSVLRRPPHPPAETRPRREGQKRPSRTHRRPVRSGPGEVRGQFPQTRSRTHRPPDRRRLCRPGHVARPRGRDGLGADRIGAAAPSGGAEGAGGVNAIQSKRTAGLSTLSRSIVPIERSS